MENQVLPIKSEITTKQKHVTVCPRCNAKTKITTVPGQFSKLINCGGCKKMFAVQIISKETTYRYFPVSDGNVAEPITKNSSKKPKLVKSPWTKKNMKENQKDMQPPSYIKNISLLSKEPTTIDIHTEGKCSNCDYPRCSLNGGDFKFTCFEDNFQR